MKDVQEFILQLSPKVEEDQHKQSEENPLLHLVYLTILVF